MNPALLGNSRVSKLEEQLEHYKKEMKKLEVELDELQGLNNDEDGNSMQRKEDLEKIEKLERKVKVMEDEMKKLEHEKEVLEDRLEERALKGDYNPTKTKILHFK